MKWRVKYWRWINEQAGERLLKVSDKRMNRWRCAMTMTEWQPTETAEGGIQ